MKIEDEGTFDIVAKALNNLYPEFEFLVKWNDDLKGSHFRDGYKIIEDEGEIPVIEISTNNKPERVSVELIEAMAKVIGEATERSWVMVAFDLTLEYVCIKQKCDDNSRGVDW